MQDHETIEQHTAQIQDNSRRISSVEREVKTVGASAAALAALNLLNTMKAKKLKSWQLLVHTKVKQQLH